MGNDREFAESVISNAFELWFNPEILRRQESDGLEDNFSLYAAQVVFEIGAAPKVRLNGEVRGVVKARVKRAVNAGDAVRNSDISEIVGMDLGEDRPNAAHLTALLLNQRWYLLFDARYNAKRIEHHVRVARQFTAVAELATENGHLHAAVENLYAAVELLAKGFLLQRPNQRLLEARTHKFIATQFNLERHLGNIPKRFSQLYNRLQRLRPCARYEVEKLRIDPASASRMCREVRDLLKHLEENRPTRTRPESKPRGPHNKS